MSLPFFPKIYEDELVYSVLARFYEKSGYMTYRDAAAELFETRLSRPNIEFMNRMTRDAREALCREASSMEELIQEHTMYPVYAKFLDRDRREKALKTLAEGNRNVSDILRVPSCRNRRFLRYCPLCAKEDREAYGETYWHRKHQVIYMNTCLKHSVMLQESRVLFESKASPSLITAESEIGEIKGGKESRGRVEAADFAEKILFSSDYYGNVSDFIKNRIKNTDYASARGKEVRITKLFEDYTDFYQGEAAIQNSWEIGKIQRGIIRNGIKICQLAYFLGIESFTAETSGRNLDEEILKAWEGEENPTYRGVARILSVSPKTVEKYCKEKGLKSCYKMRTNAEDKFARKIEAERVLWTEAVKQHPDYSYTSFLQSPEYMHTFYFLRREDKEWTDEHYPTGKAKGGRKAEDWDKLDTVNLPRVKALIEESRELQGRPVRFERAFVSRRLEISSQRLQKMKKCDEVIQENTEPYEAYWAREVKWSLEESLKEGREPTYSAVTKRINLRRSQFEACLPYLDFKTAEMISRL